MDEFTKKVLYQEKRSCDESKFLQSKGMSMRLLGVSVVFVFIFMVIYLIMEQIGITPIVGVYILNGFNQSETVIIFMFVFVVGFYITTLIFWYSVKSIRNNQCEKVYSQLKGKKE